MKILVFDDNKINRESARAQLKEHELVIVGTYDEAQELLTSHTDRDKVETALKEKFGDFNPYRSDDEKKKSEYFAFEKKVIEQATTHPDFDVALVDLLVPASRQSQGPNSKEAGKEMPIGIFIGLLAAVKGKARYVAVFTDSNHHDHPASACFDAFNKHPEFNGIKGVPFEVAGSKIVLTNYSNWVNQFDPDNLEKELEYEEYKKRSDTVRAKNWREVLKHLITV